MKFAYVQQMTFFALLIGVTGFFFYMLGGYLISVFWAVVCAIVFYPLFEKFKRVLGGRATLAALTTMVGILLVVLIPLFFIGGMVVSESLNLYQTLSQSNQNSFDSKSLLDRFTRVTALLEPYGISQAEVEERVREWAVSVSKAIAASLVSFTQLTVAFIIHVSIMLYLLFFFLRDGASLKQQLLHHLPLGDAHENQLTSRFAETTEAVVKGTLAIAILQGLIGGTLFWAVGISSPVLWGVAMGVLAIIPFLGPALVWLPAAVILILTGSVIEGVIILAVGALLIGLIDEFLRPILVGRGSKMPDAVVLLATIGGLATFGVNGFIIGPIIAALFLVSWSIFGEKYKIHLHNNS